MCVAIISKQSPIGKTTCHLLPHSFIRCHQLSFNRACVCASFTYSSTHLLVNSPTHLPTHSATHLQSQPRTPLLIHDILVVHLVLIRHRVERPVNQKKNGCLGSNGLSIKRKVDVQGYGVSTSKNIFCRNLAIYSWKQIIRWSDQSIRTNRRIRAHTECKSYTNLNLSETEKKLVVRFFIVIKLSAFFVAIKPAFW